MRDSILYVSHQAVSAEEGSGGVSLAVKVNLCLLNRKSYKCWGTFKKCHHNNQANSVCIHEKIKVNLRCKNGKHYFMTATESG